MTGQKKEDYSSGKKIPHTTEPREEEQKDRKTAVEGNILFFE